MIQKDPFGADQSLRLETTHLNPTKMTTIAIANPLDWLAACTGREPIAQNLNEQAASPGALLTLLSSCR